MKTKRGSREAKTATMPPAGDVPLPPGLKQRNLKYMVRFATEYGAPTIVQPAVAQLGREAGTPGTGQTHLGGTLPSVEQLERERAKG